MPQEFHGHLDGSGKKFAIVVGRFNQLINKNLVEGAMDCLIRHQVTESDVQIFWVPGGFEIPLAAQKAAESGNFDAVICLGAIIRGATPHFEYVSSATNSGLAQISLSTGIPVTIGVLTTDTIEQAIERAGTKAGNKGWDAAIAAVEMVNLLQQMEK